MLWLHHIQVTPSSSSSSLMAISRSVTNTYQNHHQHYHHDHHHHYHQGHHVTIPPQHYTIIIPRDYFPQRNRVLMCPRSVQQPLAPYANQPSVSNRRAFHPSRCIPHTACCRIRDLPRRLRARCFRQSFLPHGDRSCFLHATVAAQRMSTDSCSV